MFLMADLMLVNLADNLKSPKIGGLEKCPKLSDLCCSGCERGSGNERSLFRVCCLPNVKANTGSVDRRT